MSWDSPIGGCGEERCRKVGNVIKTYNTFDGLGGTGNYLQGLALSMALRPRVSTPELFNLSARKTKISSLSILLRERLFLRGLKSRENHLLILTIRVIFGGHELAN